LSALKLQNSGGRIRTCDLRVMSSQIYSCKCLQIKRLCLILKDLWILAEAEPKANRSLKVDRCCKFCCKF
jgi:hypothetical protein